MYPQTLTSKWRGQLADHPSISLSSTKKILETVAKFAVLLSLSFPSRTTSSYKIARHVILSFQFEPDGRVAPGACQDQRTRGLPAQRKMKSARRRRNDGKDGPGSLPRDPCWYCDRRVELWRERERERDIYAKNRLNYSSFCRITVKLWL